ncbi:MAG: tyrosine-type recombinase/integrase [Bacilli bacterium]
MELPNKHFQGFPKEITSALEISKNLTHHAARKTFGFTVLLNNNIPMKVISKLLGHFKTTITQKYYAYVMPEKLSEQLQKLKIKLKK